MPCLSHEVSCIFLEIIFLARQSLAGLGVHDSINPAIFVDRGNMHVNCLLVMRMLFGHYMNEVCLYVRISDRIWFAESELVKWVKALQRFVGVVSVKLELGFEGNNEPVLLRGASPNCTGDLSRALCAVKSWTSFYKPTWMKTCGSSLKEKWLTSLSPSTKHYMVHVYAHTRIINFWTNSIQGMGRLFRPTFFTSFIASRHL